MALTISARCASRPMFGLPSARLPLAFTQVAVSRGCQKLVLVGAVPAVVVAIATYTVTLNSTRLPTVYATELSYTGKSKL